VSILQDPIYLKPETLDRALDYLTEYPQATLWAGGTDLIVHLEHKKLKVSGIIDLTSIPELRFIEDCGDKVRIGALTTIYEIQTSPVIKKEFAFLAQAALVLASWQIRTLATIGGNIVTAAPSAETGCPLILLDGNIIVQSKNGERKIPTNQFFKGPGKCDLAPGEIVKEIELEKLPHGYQTIYQKERLRRSMDIALANAACVLNLDGDKCQEARIGLGAVAPVPMRAVKTEAVLNGQVMSDELVEKAAQTAASECKPITDIRATADYRRDLIYALVKRQLTALWKAGAE
jgi:carbon-monoxide dehydrogenase medium subunit